MDAGEGVGEPGLRIDAVEFGGFDRGVGDGGGFAAGLRSDEEVVLAAQGHRPFILPMSAKSGRFIIVGIPILAGASVFEG